MRASALSGSCAALMAVSVFAPGTRAATVHVPAEQPTIQAGVMAAAPGDTVLVAPGRYLEMIQLRPGVTLRAAQGPDSTILVSPGLGKKPTEERLMEVPEGCDRSTLIEGFTFDAGGLAGCAIYVDHAQPTIRGNRIVGFGWGIHLHFSDARIEENVIDDCNAFGLLIRASSPEIFRNTVRGSGSQAISISGKSARPLIGGSPENGNKIYDNQASIVNTSRSDIVATHNDWGWETTLEMDRKGWPADIIALQDGNDRAKSGRDKGKVDYRHWVRPQGAAPAGDAGGPPLLVPILVAALLVAVFLGVSLRRRAARA
ncbi:MAG: right-handed parallel beta-helix repeat-containing protein [Candidatus Eiseniibacteriota bacterium]